MIVPRYWSEASHVEKRPERRQVTVRRFGWSSESQEAADEHAEERLREAVEALRKTDRKGLGTFVRRERRIPYNGADGLPIREEIVEDCPGADAVVTRNSYGALCLNTSGAMFVDIDRPASPDRWWGCAGFFVGVWAGFFLERLVIPGQINPILSAGAGGVIGAVVSMMILRLAASFDDRRTNLAGWVKRKVEEWCRGEPDWQVRVYGTPGGVRLLATHAEFDPRSEIVRDFMTHVGADRIYMRMCHLQNCFRARVSPKPWRAGVGDHFYSGGVWPVTDPDKLGRRNAWVERYEEKADRFASCRWIADVGDGSPDAAVAKVREIHDEMSRALSPIALA